MATGNDVTATMVNLMPVLDGAAHVRGEDRHARKRSELEAVRTKLDSLVRERERVCGLAQTASDVAAVEYRLASDHLEALAELAERYADLAEQAFAACDVQERIVADCRREADALAEVAECASKPFRRVEKPLERRKEVLEKRLERAGRRA